MKLNTPIRREPIFTAEGAKASHINSEQELRRSVMACMLWEDSFYESGVSIASRIAALIPTVRAEAVAAMAVEAREQMKLRHVPLLIVREMARHKTHRALVAETLARVIQRPDELSEFLSIYWKEKKTPIAKQVKKGLAAAFQKFNAYSLAKYNRAGAIKLRDVLFLCHAKPKDDAQAVLFKQLVDGTLATPDTWEVELSASKDKAGSWTRLVAEKKLGALALLRNLRNMQEAGIPDPALREALAEMKVERVLPFRFISAAKHAPQLEPELEAAMFKCVADIPKLAGVTILCIDTSGSMSSKVSGKSDISRRDAAAALAMLLREICEAGSIIAFGTDAGLVPPRRGFALNDAIGSGLYGHGTDVGRACALAAQVFGRLTEGTPARIIVITDEQSATPVGPPPKGCRGYFINVASEKNGVGYGPWTHLDGWSAAVVSYIQAFETVE